MYRYVVTMQLLSETIFGSGESKNGVVNTDILIDKNGFPYFSGKTFKGDLKKVFNTILKPYYEANTKIDLQAKISDFFGSIAKKEGKLKFSNFYLSKDIISVFSKDKLKDYNEEIKKDIILNTLTEIRFNIRMDNENGVAENKSLRASRVLRKGLKFEGYIESENELTEDEYEVLQNGIAALKHLGVNKSRGKGLVKVEISRIENLVGKLDCKIKEDFEYIFYELYLEEPVKVGDSKSKDDYEESKLYLTGSAIRGAVLNRYIKKHSINFKDVLKNTFFSDAYPIYEEGGEKYFSFPTPNTFIISKETDKKESKKFNKNEFSNILEQDNNEERRVQKLKKGNFSYYTGETLFQFDVNKDFRFHHSNEKDEKNIFRYESISRGQKFYGFIDVSKIEKEEKTNLVNLLKEKPVLYLGGSRTGGYGRTKIISLDIIEHFNKLKERLGYFKISNNNKYTDIYFLSDTILRDDNHQIKSMFTKEYIKEKLDIDMNDNNTIQQIDSTIITGFNSKWQCQVPQVYGIEKGSCVRIKNISDKDINEFMQQYHGDKRQDGLGRVIINPKFLKVEDIELKEYFCDINYNERIEEHNQECVRYLRECMDKNIIDMFIKKYIYKMINESKIKCIFDEDTTLSQINKLISDINRCLSSKENVLKEFEKYIKSLRYVSVNKDRNMKNMKLLDINITKDICLKDFADNSGNIGNKLIDEVFGKKKNELIYENKPNIDELILNIVKQYLYYLGKGKKGLE
ncbi:RAMP superfamily CRISPR-associated protein [Clostridium lundense]|uniref:RAMP superfamily CRISPR-associated protein n=1 Tax=Clostridium lundense TaxID=319475 RepID=UPI000486E9DF|nr:RAMP superfamily CRISPR-associated protein [Clostridium lundense]